MRIEDVFNRVDEVFGDDAVVYGAWVDRDAEEKSNRTNWLIDYKNGRTDITFLEYLFDKKIEDQRDAGIYSAFRYNQEALSRFVIASDHIRKVLVLIAKANEKLPNTRDAEFVKYHNGDHPIIMCDTRNVCNVNRDTSKASIYLVWDGVMHSSDEKTVLEFVCNDEGDWSEL